MIQCSQLMSETFIYCYKSHKPFRTIPARPIFLSAQHVFTPDSMNHSKRPHLQHSPYLKTNPRRYPILTQNLTKKKHDRT